MRSHACGVKTARAGGVTLVELLVTLVLVALLMAPLASMLSLGATSSTVQANQLDLQTQAQFALRRIALQIQQSSVAPQVLSSSSTTLGPNTYDLQTGTQAGTLRLVETIAGNAHVLAEPVTSFSMSAMPSTNIQVQGLVAVALTLARDGAQASLNDVTRLGGAR